MSFTIRHVEQNGLHLVRLTDENNATTVSVLPEYGATLHEFLVRQKDGTEFNVIDNYHSADELKKEMTRSFQGTETLTLPMQDPRWQV